MYHISQNDLTMGTEDFHTVVHLENIDSDKRFVNVQLWILYCSRMSHQHLKSFHHFECHLEALKTLVVRFHFLLHLAEFAAPLKQHNIRFFKKRDSFILYFTVLPLIQMWLFYVMWMWGEKKMAIQLEKQITKAMKIWLLLCYIKPEDRKIVWTII